MNCPKRSRSKSAAASPRTSTGWPNRPVKMTDPISQHPQHSPSRRRAGTFRLALALVLAGLGLAGPATAAIDPNDLLPVDEAFALTAEATSPDRISIHWRIADGYYLYRHRIGVQADAAFAAQALQLPKG